MYIKYKRKGTFLCLLFVGTGPELKTIKKFKNFNLNNGDFFGEKHKAKVHPRNTQKMMMTLLKHIHICDILRQLVIIGHFLIHLMIHPLSTLHVFIPVPG